MTLIEFLTYKAYNYLCLYRKSTNTNLTSLPPCSALSDKFEKEKPNFIALDKKKERDRASESEFKLKVAMAKHFPYLWKTSTDTSGLHKIYVTLISNATRLIAHRAEHEINRDTPRNIA